MPFTASDCQRARLEFPALARRQGELPIAYLDGPAGSQVPTPVIDAIAGYYRESNANTHGQFATSQRSDELVHLVREKAASFLGAADWRTISFGANMTTLTFALAHAVARACSPGDEIVITQLDHEANRGPWLGLAERGLVIREIALRPDGTLDAESLAAEIGPRTRLVAMGLASNALGTVNDVALARELTRAVGAWLLLDAVHYAPHFAVDVAALDADFLLCSAYKFYGPHIGLLYSRPGLLDTLATDRLRTQDPAGPFRIETGTLHHAALVGVGAAIDFLASWGRGDDLRQQLVDAMSGIGEWEGALARRYWSAVRAIPGVTVHGPDFGAFRRAPTVSITLGGATAEAVARRLAERAIQVWDGDFYAVRAVEVLGLAAVGGLLRTGFLLYNTPEEVDRLLTGLAEVAATA
ncbi:MAG: cysteine desulfurase-like protein [Thermoanaerobaculia bacterium]|jgi:cysteine desulfurase family protein (TIGR01976 family)|nr:cysteine desulfurase-like protein [Thermoanaerobaculia bacterium]MBP9824502.1 cysteine desulfurase-like protein [Thermoanaerobaculia bacterium]